jgi:hypothetical protein
MDLNNIIDLVNKSKITTIGYNYKSEPLLELLISKLNYKKIINKNINVFELIRNLKLNSVLNNDIIPSFLLLDLNFIPFNINKSKHIIVKQILSDITKDLNKTNYKLIIISHINKTSSIANDITYPSIVGGLSPIYMSELFITLVDDKIKIMKNRYDG